MLVFAIMAVFIAGLMIGRTPEYLGKKIEAFDMKMASITILITPLVVLLGTALATMTEAGRAGILNPGPHGFSEIDVYKRQVLYSGTTCPFSQRCRFVLFEKGMDFEIRDIDLFNKPEEISAMNPYGQVPILVERELILYESNIINEYIDERFPHPQLMPADPLMLSLIHICTDTG